MKIFTINDCKSQPTTAIKTKFAQFWQPIKPFPAYKSCSSRNQNNDLDSAQVCIPRRLGFLARKLRTFGRVREENPAKNFCSPTWQAPEGSNFVSQDVCKLLRLSNWWISTQKRLLGVLYYAWPGPDTCCCTVDDDSLASNPVSISCL